MCCRLFCLSRAPWHVVWGGGGGGIFCLLKNGGYYGSTLCRAGIHNFGFCVITREILASPKLVHLERYTSNLVVGDLDLVSRSWGYFSEIGFCSMSQEIIYQASSYLAYRCTMEDTDQVWKRVTDARSQGSLVIKKWNWLPLDMLRNNWPSLLIFGVYMCTTEKYRSSSKVVDLDLVSRSQGS